MQRHKPSFTWIIILPASYHHKLRLADSKRYPYAPKRQDKPLIHGVHSAVVVTSETEKAELEKNGCINARFQWDNQGNPHNQYVFRMMDIASGEGFGTQFTPRRDQEVLVGFLNGNVDRPYVLGGAYNGDHLPPFELPKYQNVSGFKSRTAKSLEKDSANTLAFDDTTGQEQIRLQAEKDLHIRAKENILTQIGNGSTRKVSKDQDIHAEDEIVYQSAKHLTLSAGSSRLHLTPNKMVIQGKKIRLNRPPMSLPPKALLPIQSDLIAEATPTVTDTPEETCDCTEAWAEIQAPIDAIVAIEDPIERNKKISAMYASIYQQNPQVAWPGLGAFASKQVGCALEYTQQEIYRTNYFEPSGINISAEMAMNNTQGMWARIGYESLAKGNVLVFKSIAPALNFYNRYGLAKLKTCANTQKPVIAPKLIHGLELIEQEQIVDGNKLMIEYEQLDVLNQPMYQDSYFGTLSHLNQLAYKSVVGRLLGAQETALVFSSACKGEPKVSFEANNLADYRQRTKFTNKALLTFEQLLKEDNGKALKGELEKIKKMGQ